MELTVALSNPSLGPLLARALQTVAGLAGDPAAHEVAVSALPARLGQIIEAMKAVLDEHPEGLRTVEVRQAVEARLGRSVSASTVKSNLVDGSAFERVAYGRYRLTLAST
jgi:hypothetical protein